MVVVLRRLPAVPMALTAVLWACGGPSTDPVPAGPEPADSQDPAISLADVTAESGIAFSHQSFATEQRFLPETMGAGVAVFDMDGDALPDLFFVDGAPVSSLTLAASGERPAGAVYRNLGGEGTIRFEDVTASAGLGDAFLGMGTAVGDVDNDGRTDLFVSGVGTQRLYRNVSDGEGSIRFEDVTERSGLRLRATPDDVGFGSSAAFLDADGDGRLDLYVGRYVPWSPAGDVRCSPDGRRHTYCTPEVYPSAPNVFYRNLGTNDRPGDDGVPRFEEQTTAWGLHQPAGKTLGVAVLDHDGDEGPGDGRPDLAVANDTDRNHLFVQSRPGRYEEVGVGSGMAYSVSGATRGAMGIDVGDIDGDGLADLAVGNFAQEMTALYAAQSGGLFRDEAASLGIGLPSLMQVAFGTLLVDLDLDGHLDLLLANGHIEPEIRQYQSVQAYAQPLGVYRNLGDDAGFEQITADSGPLAESWVARGLAVGDLDQDGDLDLVLTQNGRPARILRNDGPRGSWLRLRLEGTASNRTGYGAVVEATAGGRVQRRYFGSGRSYLSASEPVLTFGLGDAESVERVEVTWPSGRVQTVESATVNEVLVVREPDA